jgi:hypothetical protein
MLGADIAGVDDVRDPSQMAHGFRPQQPMRIRNHADPDHSASPDFMPKRGA